MSRHNNSGVPNLSVERQLREFTSTADHSDPLQAFDDLFVTSTVPLSIGDLVRGSGLFPEDVIVRLNRYANVGFLGVYGAAAPRTFKYEDMQPPICFPRRLLRRLLQ